MNSKKWIAVALFVIVIILSFATSSLKNSFKKDTENLSALNFPGLTDRSVKEKVVEQGLSKDKIAYLEVLGAIAEGSPNSKVYNHKNFLDEIKHIHSDPDVKAIILYVDSPGGGVYQIAQSYKKLKELKLERELPIYVSFGPVAASAGYYIAMLGDKIFASEETITGSIGVIMSFKNFSGAMEKLGIKENTIKSAEFKDIGSPTRDMTEKDAEIFQNMLNENYNNFLNVVADGRKMDMNTVKKIADGRVYSGKQAKNLNLVDELGYFEDALDALHNDYDLANASLVKYTHNSLFDNPFSDFFPSFFGKYIDSALGYNNNFPNPQYILDGDYYGN